MAICDWTNCTEKKAKLTRKSENAVDSDHVLKFVYDEEAEMYTRLFKHLCVTLCIFERYA